MEKILCTVLDEACIKVREVRGLQRRCGKSWVGHAMSFIIIHLPRPASVASKETSWPPSQVRRKSQCTLSQTRRSKICDILLRIVGPTSRSVFGWPCLQWTSRGGQLEAWLSALSKCFPKGSGY